MQGKKGKDKKGAQLKRHAVQGDDGEQRSNIDTLEDAKGLARKESQTPLSSSTSSVPSMSKTSFIASRGSLPMNSAFRTR